MKEEKLIEVIGFHGGVLYYSAKERHLYVQRGKMRNGDPYLACYDTVFNKSISKCSAKRVYNTANRYSRSTNPNHTKHGNHEIIYRDLVSLNNMKNQCRYLAQNFPTSAHKIPIKEIFLQEMARYIYPSNCNILILLNCTNVTLHEKISRRKKYLEIQCRCLRTCKKMWVAFCYLKLRKISVAY